MRLKLTIYLFICFLICGCYSKEPRKTSINLPNEARDLANLRTYSLPANPDTIILKKAKAYGANDDVVVGRFLGMVADNRGRVYIADLDQKNIHVFKPDGSFVTDIGRAGRGPGEFDHINKMRIHDNRLYVRDSHLKRISVYSLESLTFLYTIKFKSENWQHIKPLTSYTPVQYYVQNNETLLLEFTPGLRLDKSEYEKSLSDGKYGKSYFYRINSKGEIISDKIHEQIAERLAFMDFRGGTHIGHFPFYDKPLLAVSANGHIYSAHTRNFLIEEYDPSGSYLRAFFYPYNNSKLYDDKVIDSYDHGFPSPKLNYVKETNLPETWPALHTMRFDDQNRLWISTITNNKEVYQWWVLNKSGKLLGRFTWPREEPIEDIKNGFVYTERYVEKEGLQKIFKYKIKFKDS